MKKYVLFIRVIRNKIRKVETLEDEIQNRTLARKWINVETNSRIKERINMCNCIFTSRKREKKVKTMNNHMQYVEFVVVLHCTYEII